MSKFFIAKFSKETRKLTAQALTTFIIKGYKAQTLFGVLVMALITVFKLPLMPPPWD